MKSTFWLLFCFLFVCSPVAFSQMKGGAPKAGGIERKQITEEIVHDFEVISYPKGRIVGGSSSLDGLSPEADLDKT